MLVINNIIHNVLSVHIVKKFLQIHHFILKMVYHIVKKIGMNYLQQNALHVHYQLKLVIDGLKQFDSIEISLQDGVAEDVRFRFPAELADA